MTFPFSAVVGQDDAQLALLLAAVDPGIGGVLLRGDKGSAKSTLARGLAGLLPAGAPFVELPVGATEDRVVGGLDVGAALGRGEARLRPGLLAAAHGGVLYVDEVNLLPDHLVDVLLDAAAAGVHRVERDGVSHVHPSRFVLVGSMNPEEGELRPQLLDRFGLAVEVRAPRDPAVRAEAVRRRLDFDGADPPLEAPGGAGVAAAAAAGMAVAAAAGDRALADRLAACGPAALPAEVVHFAARLALAVGAEGLRADLVLCRAARALAAWEGRAEAAVADVERVAPMALAHRRRRRPFDPPTLPPEELAAALEEAGRQASPPPSPPPSPGEGPAGRPPQDDQIDGRQIDGHWADVAGDALRAPAAPLSLAPSGPVGAAVSGPAVRGPAVGDRAPGPGGPRAVAVAATVRAAATRQAWAGASPAGSAGAAAAADAEAATARVVTAADVREPVRRRPRDRCVVLAVDTSGSMGSRERVEAAAGAVLGLLADAYRSRHRVALVTFRGQEAEVVLPPTASVEVARARLGGLPTGGATPLAEGLVAALETARRAQAAGDAPLLVLLSDGRATAGPGAFDRSLEAAAEVAGAGVAAVVLDADPAAGGPDGFAGRVAAALGAPCLPLAAVTSATVEAAIRAGLGGGR